MNVRIGRNSNKITYRSVTTNEVSSALELAWRVFLQFEAPEYSKEGVTSFYDSIHNPEFINQLKVYGAFLGEEMVGMLATRSNGAHVALFFVEAKYQGQGIGKQLFGLAVKNNEIGTITVNSSPYAVGIYHKLGFVDTNTEQVTDGIRYTPMIYRGGN